MSPHGWTAKELEALPTLAVGQVDSLKVEDEDEFSPFRLWLSRGGVEDGEPYANKVTIERFVSTEGRWRETATYRG